MSTKTASLGALLSVTDGKLMAPIIDVGALLSFMVGEPVFTHQLPMAADAVKPDLLEQHPWLKDVLVPAALTGEKACLAWLAEASERYGAFHEVKPNPLAWGRHDPIADYRNLGGKGEVIAIDMTDRP